MRENEWEETRQAVKQKEKRRPKGGRERRVFKHRRQRKK